MVNGLDMSVLLGFYQAQRNASPSALAAGNARIAQMQALQTLDYVTTIDGGRDPEDVFEDLKPVLFGKYAK